MPSLSRYLAFVGLTTIMVLTPGVGTAVLTRLTLEHGRAVAHRGIAGILSGILLYGLLSALGVAALLVHSPGLLRGVQLCGAAWVAWLGVSSLLRLRHEREAASDAAAVARSAVSSRGYQVGFTTTLLNPSIAVFYLTIVPQFLAPGSSPLTGTLVLLATHVLISGTWQLAYVHGIHRLSAALASPRTRAALDALTGVALLYLAIRILVPQG